jgi:hypothetical protein
MHYLQKRYCVFRTKKQFLLFNKFINFCFTCKVNNKVCEFTEFPKRWASTPSEQFHPKQKTKETEVNIDTPNTHTDDSSDCKLLCSVNKVTMI